jgi:hypothetical protein
MRMHETRVPVRKVIVLNICSLNSQYDLMCLLQLIVLRYYGITVLRLISFK